MYNYIIEVYIKTIASLCNLYIDYIKRLLCYIIVHLLVMEKKRCMVHVSK